MQRGTFTLPHTPTPNNSAYSKMLQTLQTYQILLMLEILDSSWWLLFRFFWRRFPSRLRQKFPPDFRRTISPFRPASRVSWRRSPSNRDLGTGNCQKSSASPVQHLFVEWCFFSFFSATRAERPFPSFRGPGLLSGPKTHFSGVDFKPSSHQAISRSSGEAPHGSTALDLSRKDQEWSGPRHGFLLFFFFSGLKIPVLMSRQLLCPKKQSYAQCLVCDGRFRALFLGDVCFDCFSCMFLVGSHV